MLIVTTDRLSAFDVVLPDPIPARAEMLTQIAQLLVREARHVMPNQLSDTTLARVVPDAAERRCSMPTAA